jgi:hypothetical protein
MVLSSESLIQITVCKLIPHVTAHNHIESAGPDMLLCNVINYVIIQNIFKLGI